MTDRKRILIVDDEPTLCEVLRFNLEAEGYEVHTANSAEDALTMDLSSFNLVLLDIMMGEVSGIQLASIMKKRKDTADIPIIFCTAKDSVDDMVQGLELGADDYITKPYSVKNIIARVKTVLRRVAAAKTNTENENDVITFEKLKISLPNKVCTIDDNEIKMPKKEFELLVLLLSNRGRLFSRQEILNRVWSDEVVVLYRVVDVNITRLRTKLGDYGKHIVTKTGYGYVFTD